MAHGVDGPIDRLLINPFVVGHLPRPGGLLPPLDFLLLGKQLVEEASILGGELPDPVEDVVDGRLAHELTGSL
jgi:hypothetical protein